MIAWGKLNGTVKDLSFKGQNLISLLILIAALGAGAYLIYDPTQSIFVYIILALSLLRDAAQSASLTAARACSVFATCSV